MTFLLADRVQESCTSPGTGTVTLQGAAAGYQTFSSGVGNGNTVYYCIADQIGSNWEVGIGTYTAAGNTFARTTVLSSSNSGSLVNFATGTQNIWVDYPAGRAITQNTTANNVEIYNNQFPTIRPSLLLDFAGTQTLDPRITFTRASTGTYYDGSTAMAEQNLLTYSNTFNNAAWVVTSGTVGSGVTDPAGATTAFSFTASGANATLLQTLTETATPYTFTIYIQRVTGTGNVDITVDGVTYATQTITGSWARYTVTTTPSAGSKTVGIRLVTSGDAVNIYSAQLENRSSATAANITTTAALTNYIPVLKTASANAPRFDVNPTTEESLGLLIEQQSTNLLTYSSAFDNAVWGKTNVSVTTAADIAPDGTQTAQLLVENTTASVSHSVAESISIVSGTSYTLSVFAKTSGRRLWLRATGTTTFANAYFDLSTGTVTSGTGTITSVGNGWYRCSVTGTSDLTGSGNQLIYLADSSNNSTYTGNGYSGVYLWGAQLEASAFSTSYIPTVASQVTRAADNASMTGTNFSSWFNAGQGSFYGNFSRNSTVSNQWFFALNPSSGVIDTVLGSSSANFRYGPSNNTIVSGTFSSAAFACSYSGSSASLSVNGSAVVTSSPTPVSGMTTLFIGTSPQGGADTINGRIKRIAYYPLALTSANLQALTTQ